MCTERPLRVCRSCPRVSHKTSPPRDEVGATGGRCLVTARVWGALIRDLEVTKWGGQEDVMGYEDWECSYDARQSPWKGATKRRSWNCIFGPIRAERAVPYP